jgi:hypothetical protein
MQSNGLGQAALNENSWLDRLGSNLDGGASLNGSATMRSVYGEKSPARSTFTVSSDPAATTFRTSTPTTRMPPSIRTLSTVSAGLAGTPPGWPGSGWTNRTSSVCWSAEATST